MPSLASLADKRGCQWRSYPWQKKLLARLVVIGCFATAVYVSVVHRGTSTLAGVQSVTNHRNSITISVTLICLCGI